MKTLTTVLKFVVFLVLLLLPFGGRWFWYHHGKYDHPNITPIDLARISTTLEKYSPYVDHPLLGKGRVVIDLTHANNLLVDDLTPLKSRLALRGADVEIFDSGSDGTLATRLHGATALVELVPTFAYGTEQRQSIVDFVHDGGRLLLAADPTRPVPSYQDPGFIDLYSVLFPESAIPAVNSLASAFGLSYFEDYVYNLSDYDANYRNVKFHTFPKNTPLTQGLDQVTLFAAHTLRGNGLPLITGDERTFSNVRTGETGLVSAMLAEDGKVLALGDITFMTSPYYQVSDNDRLLSQISDWLATDSRLWDLKDFPYLFAGPVDLVQTFAESVDPRLIAQSTPLIQLFEQSGIPLGLRTQANPEHNALYISTFAELDTVESFLFAANITITFTNTETTTVTVETTEPEPANSDETKETLEKPDEMIAVKDFGVFNARGSSLYVVNRKANTTSLIVLAEDEKAVLSAIERLLTANFDGCVSQQDVMICSTGEIPVIEEPVEEPTPEGNGDTGYGEPTLLKKVLILSVDNGVNGKRNSATEIEMALTGLYDVTVWSVVAQGNPVDSDLAGYDAYIVDTGDYAYDDEIGGVFDSMNLLGNILLIGEQPYPVDGEFIKTAPIEDLIVADAQHPLAFMFSEGETITLSASESGNSAIVLPKDFFIDTDTSTVVFERGPGSGEAGSAALYASDDGTGQKFVIATFAFYRLPEDKQYPFIFNVVEWLTVE